MTSQPSPVGMVSEGLSRILDLAGGVLLLALGWRMFFVTDSALQTPALVVGIVGLVARWTDRGPHKTSALPIFMYAYVGVSLASSMVHRPVAGTHSGEVSWLTAFAPAFHLVVMAVFVCGAAYLLRSERRLSVFVVLFVGAVLVSAAQIVFDRATHYVDFVRSGTMSFPSIPQWGGVHGNSLVLALGVPFVLASSQNCRPTRHFIAGLLLGAALLGSAYANGTRGGLVTVALTSVLMGTVVLKRRPWGRRLLLSAGALCLVAMVGVSWAMWGGRMSIEGSGRGAIWWLVGHLILDHPLVGVGPGNYAQAMRDAGYAALLGSSEGTINAHNLLLRVAAEAGVAGMVCLLAFLLGMVRSCHKAWLAGRLPIVSLGLCLALVAFLVHSVSEDFLAARAEVERTRLIVWMCFGAALAVARLPYSSRRTS